jgi:hypothetical protein
MTELMASLAALKPNKSSRKSNERSGMNLACLLLFPKAFNSQLINKNLKKI